MVLSDSQWSALANYILLYDQIVIPTGNFLILPVLRIMLGDDVFEELLKNNVIVLARHDKWFSYIGNGGGLQFFSIGEGSSQDRNQQNLFHSYFAPMDEAIETALVTTAPISSRERKNQLANLLSEKVVPVCADIQPEAFRHETYHDVLGSPYLRDFLSLRNNGRSLDRLRGIAANQVRIYSPHHSTLDQQESPEITSLLRVAFENFVLGIGTDVQASEITGDDSTLALLKAKGQRAGAAIEGVNAFTRIQEIAGIPDIGVAFAKKELSAEQLLDLRESKHAKSFRDWVGSETGTDEKEGDIVRRYVESIGKPSLIERLPAKLLRFAVTTGASAINPILGGVTSAVDSLFLSKWFPGKPPRLFLEHAKSVLLKNEQKKAVPPPSMSGRNRNRPCSCGSGKKYKKCCGQ